MTACQCLWRLPRVYPPVGQVSTHFFYFVQAQSHPRQLDGVEGQLRIYLEHQVLLSMRISSYLTSPVVT